MPKFRAWINGLTTTDLADDDRFATVDASTSGTVHTKWSLIKSTLQTAFDSRYDRPITLRAADWAPVVGSPVEGNILRHPVTLFAVQEIVGSIVELPDSWATYDVEIFTVQSATTTGDSQWRWADDDAGDGDTIANPSDYTASTAITSPAANVVKATTIASGRTNPGKPIAAQVYRVSTSDTVSPASDIGLLLVKLTRAS